MNKEQAIKSPKVSTGVKVKTKTFKERKAANAFRKEVETTTGRKLPKIKNRSFKDRKAVNAVRAQTKPVKK